MQATTTPLLHVITDIDGVVVETEGYHRRAYNALFKELGIDLFYDDDGYAKRLHQVGGAKFAEIMDHLGTCENARETEKVRLYDRKTELFTNLIVTDLKSGALEPRPGVLRLFREIMGAGIVLSAASTCVKSAAIEILRHGLGQDVFEYLTTICAGDDCAKKKPEPDIYLMAAAQCGTLPENCLAIEDTVHGMNAALGAGMKCIVTPSEYTLSDDFTGSHRLVDTLEEIQLPDLLSLFSPPG
jgi:beta-phosphoglucomutase-like phosphatase (HAD superfamily)